MNGKGIFYYKNGNRFEGNFVNGKTDDGILFDKEDNQITVVAWLVLFFYYKI